MNDHKSDAGRFVPLLHLRPGEHVRVCAINGGRFQVRRLSMLGIRPGIEAHVVHGPGLHGVVLLVGGGRIALGHGIIENILVERLSESHESTTVRESRP